METWTGEATSHVERALRNREAGSVVRVKEGGGS